MDSDTGGRKIEDKLRCRGRYPNIIIREGPIADSKELDEDVRVEYNLKGGGRDRNNECKKHS
ncbi:MAG: hypothetical protein QXU95_05825 [Candidatus Bathyarchaeia archaeon]|nr:hypothetical protein [Candidatus Bathyarchaeota archaeon]